MLLVEITLVPAVASEGERESEIAESTSYFHEHLVLPQTSWALRGNRSRGSLKVVDS